MVQVEDHKMRSECAKEFGSIQTALAFHKDWREEQSDLLQRIEREITKLTGNGNRGKMDDLSNRLFSIEKLLIDHTARSESSQHRIERLEETTKMLENRLFSTSLKVAGAIGVFAIIFQLTWDYLIK
jgi:hypothetical protein